MKFTTKVLGAVLLAFSTVNASAQAKLKINEVMVNNQTNYVDQYGNHGTWIEIYNSSGTSTNLAGCYLSDDPNNLKKYLVTKGDRNTVIGPRQFLVFWADGDATRGTFYTNFTLTAGAKNVVCLSDPGGKLIDMLEIPESAGMPNQAYGRTIDGGSETGPLPNPTPNINNVTQNQDAANLKFKKNDPTGIGMSITAMSVVFCALILLYLSFKYTGKLHVRMSHKKRQSRANKDDVSVKTAYANEDGEISGEIVAAIGAAIYQMQNASHDMENTILTIEKRVSNYSPWGSKIYGLRQTPQLKR